MVVYVAVASGKNHYCLQGETIAVPLTGEVRSGFLASTVTDTYGLGSANCPWRLTAQLGQRLNITLYDFNTQSKTDSPDVCKVYAVIRDKVMLAVFPHNKPTFIHNMRMFAHNNVMLIHSRASSALGHTPFPNFFTVTYMKCKSIFFFYIFQIKSIDTFHMISVCNSLKFAEYKYRKIQALEHIFPSFMIKRCLQTAEGRETCKIPPQTPSQLLYQSFTSISTTLSPDLCLLSLISILEAVIYHSLLLCKSCYRSVLSLQFYLSLIAPHFLLSRLEPHVLWLRTFWTVIHASLDP